MTRLMIAGIDFRTGFQSHPISGWLFYCPLTRGGKDREHDRR